MAPNVEDDYLEIAHQRAAEKKTHVSFPQLKYPSLRDNGLKDPVTWLLGKSMDDGAEGLWRVHNGLYDLNEFIYKHPGGSDWLELTKGTDITEAFECHHLNPAVWKILEKFYVRDAQTPRNSPFTFKDDGFYRTLKRAVAEELNKLDQKSIKRKTDMLTDGLLVTCLVSSALTCWAKDYWVVMVSYLVASLTVAWLTVASHNYLHRRTNWRMYLFNFSMWSYRDFRVSHALSHHLYPNTLMDLEVSGFEPIVLWNPRQKPLLAKFAFVIEQIVFPFLFFLNFFKRFIQNFIREGFFKNHYRWHDGVFLLLPVWMWLISGASAYDVLISWIWITCTASYIFFTIGSNAAHHHPKLFKDGDQVRDETPDWGIHELETVMDRIEINGSLFKVMTFFGDHVLHHLFPTLDHGLLPHLYPVFLEHCQKFKGKYRVTSQFDLIIGQILMTLKTEPTLLKDRL